MKQEGIVIAKQDQTVTVRVRRQNGCGENCAHCGMCGQPEETVQAAGDAPVGARVEIETPDGAVLLGLASLFILPVILPLAAYLLAAALISTEAGIGLAAVTLAVCLLWVRALNRCGRYLRKTKAVVVRVIDNTCNP